MNEPTHLDLFSGIGGFSIAAQACGFRTVAFCECEPYCQQVLIEKFGAVPHTAVGRLSKQRLRHENIESSKLSSGDRPILHPDIFALDGTQYRGVTLLTGGFPCQPFSCAGKRRGASDDRAIWPQMRRVIAEARPRWVLAENVPGIITMELDHCLSDLEALGYATGTLVIPACAVDARHIRSRVWIIASYIGLPAWIPCPDGCGEFYCTIHEQHAFECPCPAIEEWDTDPYSDIVPDPGRKLLQGRRRKSAQGPAQWLPEPDVGRVAHGIPARTHRLRALGNAIVPQVAQEIIQAIAEQL